MDETKFENKLSCFYANVKKLVTDYMQYIDTQVSKHSVVLGDINKALDEIIELQNSILNGGEGV